MSLTRRHFAATAVALAAAPALRAQERAPMRILVGFAPGGSADALARILAERLRGPLGMNVIVENKVGAAGRIALGELRRAAPDGLTLCLAAGANMVAMPWAFRNLGYDPVKDFSPVSGVATFDFAVTVGPAAPAGNLKAVLEWMRANPAKAVYGHGGAGTLPHFTGLLLSQVTGVQLTHVPYRGAAPAAQDLAAGSIPLMIDTAAETMEMHRAGRVRILAVTGEKRSARLPDIPTLKEQGFDVTSDGYMGLYGPAGMAAPVVSRLSAAVAEVMQSQEVRERIAQLGLVPGATTPSELARMQESHLRRWEAPIKASGFTAD